MSIDGRTVWQAQDAGWWRRERIVLLGERFGAEGPAAANWLECEAKAQNAGGAVKAGYGTLKRGAFLSCPDVSVLVGAMVEVGFLRDFQEGTRTFTATISAFQADQGRGRDTLTASWRRSSTPDEAPDTPRQDPTCRDAPRARMARKTGEDSTGKDLTPQPPQSGGEGTQDPSGRRRNSRANGTNPRALVVVADTVDKQANQELIYRLVDEHHLGISAAAAYLTQARKLHGPTPTFEQTVALIPNLEPAA